MTTGVENSVMVYAIEIVVIESSGRRIEASSSSCKIIEYASHDWGYDFNDGTGWGRPLLQVTHANGSVRVIVKEHRGPWHCDLYFNKVKLLPLVGGNEERNVGTEVFFKLEQVYSPKIISAKPRAVMPPHRRRPVFSPPENCVFPNAKTLPNDMVTLIVLTHNTYDVTLTCVHSVLEKTCHPFELIVVDNASSDGTTAAFKDQPCLTLIANKENLSFSKANNTAIKSARGRDVCLLNSDVVVRHRNWLANMVKYAGSDPAIGTVGAKLLSQDDKVQHIGGGIHHNNPYHPYEHYPANVEAGNKSRFVPYNTGACLLITRVALEKVGVLDEEYPFGFEDVDYGLKVIENGLKNVYCPKAVLTHLWAYTQRKTGKGISMASLALYHRKWDQKLPEIAKKVTLDWGAPWHV